MIKEVNEYISETFPGKAITPTYIDDFTIVAAEKDWDQTIARAEQIAERAQRWAEENCVRFESEKTEWIRLGAAALEETRVIQIGDDEEKEKKRVMRWLGVWINTKLNFKEHVREKTARAARAAHCITQLCRGNNGMGVDNGRRMYIACSRQVTEYGGKVWWKGQVGLAKAIDEVNIRAMRKIGGHFRTAPTAAIEVENDMIPMRHRFNDKQRMEAVKALKRQRSHPTAIRARLEIQKLMEQDSEWNGGVGMKERKGGRGMKTAVSMLGKIVGREWEKIESWEKLYRKEAEWEKWARIETEVKIEGYDEEEKKRQGNRREEEGEITAMGVKK